MERKDLLKDAFLKAIDLNDHLKHFAIKDKPTISVIKLKVVEDICISLIDKSSSYSILMEGLKIKMESGITSSEYMIMRAKFITKQKMLIAEAERVAVIKLEKFIQL